MKKLLKTMLALTLVLAMSFAFAGCKIVIIEGNWTATEMTVENYLYVDDSQEKVVSQMKVDLIAAGVDFDVQIKEDGKFSYSYVMPELANVGFFELNEQGEGSWSENDDGNIELRFGTSEVFEEDVVVFENNNSGKLEYKLVQQDESKTIKMVVKIVLTRTGK